MNYATVQAVKGDYVKTVSGDAVLYYTETADLSWEKDNACISEILVKKGQEVKEGDVLISFDINVSSADMQELSLKLQRTLEAFEAEKEERLAAIDEAESAAEGLSGQESEIARLKAEKLQVEYEEFVYQSEYEAAQYREKIAELEDEMQRNTLTAPFDGVIDYVQTCSAGDQVEAGQVLVSMHAADEFFLSVNDDAGNLRYNMDVVIEAGKANDTQTYSGKVVTAYNILPSSVQKGRVLIRMEEEAAAEELEIGVKYRCDTEKLENVHLVDRDVVDIEQGKSYVSILEDDMIQKRYIVPGLRNNEVIWVLDGLSEGQNVIE